MAMFPPMQSMSIIKAGTVVGQDLVYGLDLLRVVVITEIIASIVFPHGNAPTVPTVCIQGLPIATIPLWLFGFVDEYHVWVDRAHNLW